MQTAVWPHSLSRRHGPHSTPRNCCSKKSGQVSHLSNWHQFQTRHKLCTERRHSRLASWKGRQFQLWRMEMYQRLRHNQLIFLTPVRRSTPHWKLSRSLLLTSVNRAMYCFFNIQIRPHLYHNRPQNPTVCMNNHRARLYLQIIPHLYELVTSNVGKSHSQKHV